jgi:tRNA1(Val) A37 N6-methylase TrmN6
MPAWRTSCVPVSELTGDVTEDAFLGGRLRLRQPKSGHRAGHDAMLLAAATPARPGDRIVDLGAGVGAAGLAVARRVGAIKLALVEFDQGLVELARANAVANAVAGEVLLLDVTSGAEGFLSAGLLPESTDVVLMNPPFNDASRHRASPDKSREMAHVAAANTLDEWVHASRRILKSGGNLVLIWRADGIGEVLAALGRGFGSLMILPVHGDAASPAIRVLVRATKGGRAPTRLLAGLVLNDRAGGPSADARSVLAGESQLPLAVP